MHRRLLLPCALVASLLSLVPQVALAGKYDLDLTRLGSGTGASFSQDDAGFRSLSSELGTIMAPKPVDTADSLGLSGFAISADFSVNTIGGGRNYWQSTSNGSADNVAPTMQIMGRKGLWPGVEVGGGATHLFDSRMWAIGGYGKIAFHEGFHHLPIPSIGVRVAGSRLLGAKDFNLSTVAPALTVSHVFGLGKTFSLTPYVGYEALIIFSRSQVLDSSPNCDEFDDFYNEDECTGPAGQQNEFVFKDAGAIVRHRPHFGVRMIFAVMRIVFEAMYTPPGGRNGSVDGTGVADNSKFQQSYTLSVGLDF
jgi:hypothetical protein